MTDFIDELWKPREGCFEIENMSKPRLGWHVCISNRYDHYYIVGNAGHVREALDYCIKPFEPTGREIMDRVMLEYREKNLALAASLIWKCREVYDEQFIFEHWGIKVTLLKGGIHGDRPKVRRYNIVTEL